MTAPATPLPDEEGTERLLRIQEVAEQADLTPRAVRYYESVGLLKPAARSDGDYRLYSADDVERLRFIKGLRDDAGFSLAEIGQLLEDEAARGITRERFRASTDPAERTAILTESLARVERQIATLRGKADKIGAMVTEAEERRARIHRHLDDIAAEPAQVAEPAQAPEPAQVAEPAQAAER